MDSQDSKRRRREGSNDADERSKYEGLDLTSDDGLKLNDSSSSRSRDREGGSTENNYGDHNGSGQSNSTREDDRDASSQDLDTRRVYVANLSDRTREEDLHQFFGKYGKIKDLKIIHDPQTQRSRGYAFITMERSEDGLAAVRENCDKKLEMEGRLLTVETAKGKYRDPSTRRPSSVRGDKRHDDGPFANHSNDRSPYDLDRRDDMNRDHYRRGYDRDARAPSSFNGVGRSYPPEYGYSMPPRDAPRSDRWRDDPYMRHEDRDYRGGYPPYPPYDDYYARGPYPPPFSNGHDRNYREFEDRGRGDWNRESFRDLPPRDAPHRDGHRDAGYRDAPPPPREARHMEQRERKDRGDRDRPPSSHWDSSRGGAPSSSSSSTWSERDDRKRARDDEGGDRRREPKKDHDRR